MLQAFKKPIFVLATLLVMTDASKKVILKCVSFIYYSI